MLRSAPMIRDDTADCQHGMHTSTSVVCVNVRNAVRDLSVCTSPGLNEQAC